MCVDKKTAVKSDLGSAKILIGTCLFPTIQNWKYFSVGGKGLDIQIKEMGRDHTYSTYMDRTVQEKLVEKEGKQSEDESENLGKHMENVMVFGGTQNKGAWKEGCGVADNAFNEKGRYDARIEVVQDTFSNIQNGKGEESEKVNDVSGEVESNTKTFEDDRVTAEVVRELQVGRGSGPVCGPFFESIEDEAPKRVKNKKSMDQEESSPLCPPSFELKLMV